MGRRPHRRAGRLLEKSFLRQLAGDHEFFTSRLALGMSSLFLAKECGLVMSSQGWEHEGGGQVRFTPERRPSPGHE